MTKVSIAKVLGFAVFAVLLVAGHAYAEPPRVAPKAPPRDTSDRGTAAGSPQCKEEDLETLARMLNKVEVCKKEKRAKYDPTRPLPKAPQKDGPPSPKYPPLEDDPDCLSYLGSLPAKAYSCLQWLIGNR